MHVSSETKHVINELFLEENNKKDVEK